MIGYLSSEQICQTLKIQESFDLENRQDSGFLMYLHVWLRQIFITEEILQDSGSETY